MSSIYSDSRLRVAESVRNVVRFMCPRAEKETAMEDLRLLLKIRQAMHWNQEGVCLCAVYHPSLRAERLVWSHCEQQQSRVTRTLTLEQFIQEQGFSAASAQHCGYWL